MQKVFMMRSGGLGSSSVDHPTEKRRCSGKNNEITVPKKCATVARLFQKNNKNNTEFLGAETAKKGCSLR